MIKTKHLTKIYQTNDLEATALKNISIQINKGEFIAIMGPSGCGKSTLLNILGLMDNPTSGMYYIEDLEVSKLSEIERTNLRKENIGFIFQDFHLLNDLSVYQNIELPLIYKRVAKEKRNIRINAVLKKIKMDHRANYYPNQLSGGQQQRAAIARALVIEPKIILADEPTGNLDSNSGQKVLNLLQELNNEGTTIVMVTHSTKYAKSANRTINMFDGQVLD